MHVSYIGDLLYLRPQEGRDLVLTTFRKHGCSYSDTARALGIQRPSLYRLVWRHGMQGQLEEARKRYDGMRRL